MKQIELTEAQKKFYKLVNVLKKSDDYLAVIENKEPVAILMTFSKFCETLGISQDMMKESLFMWTKNKEANQQMLVYRSNEPTSRSLIELVMRLDSRFCHRANLKKLFVGCLKQKTNFDHNNSIYCGKSFLFFLGEVKSVTPFNCK